MYDEDVPSEMICGECGKLAAIVEVDFGIGSYEYWGAKGIDVNIHYVSECCEVDWEDCTRVDAEEGDE